MFQMISAKQWLLILLLMATYGLSADALEVQKVRAEGRIEVRKIGGTIEGFDVFDREGYLVAPIRFSANGAFHPLTMESADLRIGISIRFSDFVSRETCGMTLTKDSFVTLEWNNDWHYPKVVFGIQFESFNAKQWKDNEGDIPFHFLICSMPEAEAFHIRGWLIATPLADPYPLQQAPHAGHPEIQSAWSRDWSYAPAIGFSQ